MLLSKIIKRTFATSGKLLTWGQTTHGWARPASSEYYTPGKVENVGQVIKVSTGQYHLGFITKDNAVYTAGFTQDNRLGQGLSPNSEVPQRLTLDSKIISLSCGNRHSVAIGEDGSLYTWGYYQALGVNADSSNASPVKIPQSAFEGEKIVSANAANDFSLAMTESGRLYTWGSGLKSLPLWEGGYQVPQEFLKAKKLCAKRHANVIKYAAIDQFILLLLDNGFIYSYGKNNGGVFGARTNPLVMSDLSLSEFYRIHNELFKNEKIVDFEAASNALIFKTESDRIFYNGFFSKYQPTPFPVNAEMKKMFATDSSVGIVTPENKIYYLNDKFIDDSELIDPKNRVFQCEDSTLAETVDIGGTYKLRYALVK